MDITTRQALFSGVLLLANRMQREYDSQLEYLTLKQWLALAVIEKLPHPIASSAVVARVLGTSHQNATKLVRALEAKGYAETAPSAHDQRARMIIRPDASPPDAVDPDFGERVLDELYEGISAAERATCFSVLERMSGNLCGQTLLPPERAD